MFLFFPVVGMNIKLNIFFFSFSSHLFRLNKTPPPPSLWYIKNLYFWYNRLYITGKLPCCVFLSICNLLWTKTNIKIAKALHPLVDTQVDPWNMKMKKKTCYNSSVTKVAPFFANHISGPFVHRFFCVLPRHFLMMIDVNHQIFCIGRGLFLQCVEIKWAWREMVQR